MNAFVATLYRNVTCAAAAILITVVCSASFVHSTARAPGSRPDTVAVAHAATPSWFGQPEPAVLVD
ncbi:MAG: hypothetical protein ACRETH_00440 [Steroidobacteraceae bacterium]